MTAGATVGLTSLIWIMQPQGAIAHPGHANPDLVHLLQSHQSLTPGLMVGGLGLALVLGAGHALTPGHGKTLAAAYLMGERQTPWHAVVLGLTTTVTHTLAVFLLGAIALLAAQLGWAERIYPILSMVSGLMVLSVGTWLLSRHLQSLDQAAHEHGHHHGADPSHHHEPNHAHKHAHEHGHPHMHTHTHAPQSLLALGIAGGLVPCPSALVLLLTAIALHRTAYGLALVTAFSLGLTLVLVGVGISVVYSRRWFDQMPPRPALRYLPVASAVVVMAVGAMLTARAIA